MGQSWKKIQMLAGMEDSLVCNAYSRCNHDHRVLILALLGEARHSIFE
jgi:hypothetical protein